MAIRRFIILMAVTALAIPGCSREWYREQADENVTELIEEKTYNRWESPWTGIDMDPRSRFYDPYDPVRPPMPPDDPDSHQYMHHVDQYEGWAHWHDSGNLDQLENPGWYEQLVTDVPSKEDGTLFLTLEDAIRLARVNAPSYQQQLETLYLSALDVSTERFRLDTQFIGGAGAGSGGRTFFNNTGVGITGAGTSSGSTFNVGTTSEIQLRRNLASAGQFVVSFANQFMWQLSGADAGSVSSGIGFAFLQPLLRAGGRQIALEVLTVAERTLLANIRAFEHYRQGFFTNLAVGINDTTGPSRRGGFQGGSGFSGFSGQGSGGFGGVGDATGFGRTGGGGGGDGGAVVTGSGFAGGGAGQVGGFVGILQQTEQLRNTETSLNAQLQTLNLLEAHLEGGLIDLAQVDQFRQSIETERANLLQSQNGLANTVESFKTFSLGLPPDVPIELDDSRIRQFRFVSDSLKRQQERLQAIVTGFGQIAANPSDEQLREVLGKLNDLNKDVAVELASAATDVQRVVDTRPERTTGMSDFEKQAFEKELTMLTENLEALQKSFDDTSQKVVSLLGSLGDRPTAVATIVSINVDLSNLIGELALIETRARLEVITLDVVRLDPKVALEIARANRLDWMNNRASLVDNWRLIEFNANRLESNVDIVLSGDIGTKGDNPLNFSGENTSTQAGIRFDAPFNRRVERNDFRQQLILYQQSRRQLIQYEDGVYRGLRSLLRNLDQLERNLEIQRRAVAISIRRVDQTRENLNRPTPPALPGQPQAQFGPTAALNLLTALSDLRNSQNNFMSVWLNYYAARMRLFQNLGVMRIDTNGLWIEESLEDAVRASSADSPLPPSVPQDWLDATGAEPAPAVEGETSDEEAAQLPPPAPAALPIHSAGLSDSRRPLTAPVGSSPTLAAAPASPHPVTPRSSGPAPRIIPVEFTSPAKPARPRERTRPLRRKPTSPASQGWRKTGT